MTLPRQIIIIIAICCLLLLSCGGRNHPIVVSLLGTSTPIATHVFNRVSTPIPIATATTSSSIITPTPLDKNLAATPLPLALPIQFKAPARPSLPSLEKTRLTPEASPTPAINYEKEVDAILSQMTVEQKVGQLFVLFFYGTSYSQYLEWTISQVNVGGIIIFGSNINTLESLATLINAAQKTATTNGAQIPLLVAIDHEGGIVNRFGDQLTEFPSNMGLAATHSLDNAKAMAEVMAIELKALGINMNLGPVVDINSNPNNPIIGVRSFGSNPAMVAEFGTAMIREFQANGVIATAKHFPGHGDTTLDSHYMLPVVSHEWPHLDTVEFVPFKKAIENDVDAIMTAHIVFPALDPDSNLPATLSKQVLTNLLRNEFGYEGLIATDSLGMGAIHQSYGFADASAMAFQAGADLLMIGNDRAYTLASQYPSYQNLLTLVRNGVISEERLDASVRRILLAKAKRGILDWQPTVLSDLPTQIRTTEHLSVATRIAEEAVTIVKDDDRLLPIDPEKRILLVYPAHHYNTIYPAFTEYASRIWPIPIGLNPGEETIKQVLAAANQVDVTIIATLNARFYPGQVNLVYTLRHHSTVVLALQSPYDLMAFPYQDTYAAIYGPVPASIQGAAKVLLGQHPPSGKLPITLPDLFLEGHGLESFESGL